MSIFGGQHKYSALKSSKRKRRTNIAKKVLKNAIIQKGDTQVHKYLRLKTRVGDIDKVGNTILTSQNYDKNQMYVTNKKQSASY